MEPRTVEELMEMANVLKKDIAEKTFLLLDIETQIKATCDHVEVNVDRWYDGHSTQRDYTCRRCKWQVPYRSDMTIVKSEYC